MATRVLITIDTELAWRHHAAGLGWEENYARGVEPAGVGLSYQLDMLNRHGLKGVFFVDPMPAIPFGPEPVRHMVETVLAAGQEVQLHIHPMWRDARPGGAVAPDAVFELCDLGRDAQQALIAEARDLLVAAGAPDPIAFRAGSYAANDDTLDALAALGIRYDSSHNGCEAPWPSALSLPRGMIAPLEHRGVIELPVSQIAERGGGFRHLQLCAVSFAELRASLDHAVARGHPAFTIVSHSFELATRDGLRVNRVARRRFERLCALLAERRDACPTAHFADLDDLPLAASATPANGRPALRAARMAEQLWSNLVEERMA